MEKMGHPGISRPKWNAAVALQPVMLCGRILQAQLFLEERKETREKKVTEALKDPRELQGQGQDLEVPKEKRYADKAYYDSLNRRNDVLNIDKIKISERLK